jgi:hypothetical protein
MSFDRKQLRDARADCLVATTMECYMPEQSILVSNFVPRLGAPTIFLLNFEHYGVWHGAGRR